MNYFLTHHLIIQFAFIDYWMSHNLASSPGLGGYGALGPASGAVALRIDKVI